MRPRLDIETIDWLLTNQDRGTQKICPQFMLLWIRKGTVIHCSDGHQHEMGEGLYGLSPRHFRDFVRGQNPDGFVICFTTECLTDISQADLLIILNLFSDYPVDLLRDCDTEIKTDVYDILRQLTKERNIHSQARPELVTCYVKILLIYLHDQAGGVDQQFWSPGFDTVRKFLALLEKNYRCMRQVGAYADELGISPSYLNQLVKKFTGVAARDHINRRILLEAKRQARYHSLTMKETAYLLGFDDLAHFSKYFKNLAGLTYTDFRKAI